MDMKTLKNKIKDIKNKISSMELPEPPDPAKTAVFGLATIVVGATAVAALKNYNDKSEVITLKTSTLNDEANTKLLSAVFENNVDDFKQALKDGAKITTLNHHNQNALMIAIARGAYGVSGYILSTPELRDNIDYKQADDKSITVMDIIQSKIDYALHKTRKHASPEELAPELEMAKRVVTQQLQKQNQEEAKGQARSNTKYDAFAIAVQNQGNTEK
jgi:ankyrin repeat protein